MRNKENSTCSRGVLEQLIPCGGKRRRLSPCNQSKNVEPVRVFFHFKKEGLSQLMHLIQEGHRRCHLNLKDVSFSVTAQKFFPLTISSLNVTKSAVPANLVIFTEDILKGKLHFFCSLSHWIKTRESL